MATVRKYRGKWEAQIRRKGYKTLSQTFATKGAASAWAKGAEREPWILPLSVQARCGL
jgi:hypothetical protein